MLSELAQVAPVERLLLLLAVGELQSLGPDELGRVGDRAHLVLHAAGACVQEAGAPLRAIDIVVRGEVALHKSSGIELLGPRTATAGLRELLRCEPMAYGSATTETLTLRLEAEDLEDILEEDFGVFMPVLLRMTRPLLADPRVLLGVFAGRAFPGVPRTRRPAALDIVERVLALRETLHFAVSKLDVLAELADLATPFRASPGTVLWGSGGRIDHPLIVASGRLCCTWAGGDGTVCSPVALGVLESACGEAARYGATAVTEVLGVIIPGTALIDAIEDCPSLAVDFLRAVALDTPGG